MPARETFYGQIVGQVVRGLREMRGWTLQSMSKSMSLATPSGLSRIETGETAMTVGQLRRVAKQFELEAAEILRQADVIAAQLEASGVVVHDDRPKELGEWLGGAAILALVAAGPDGMAAPRLGTRRTTPPSRRARSTTTGAKRSQ